MRYGTGYYNRRNFVERIAHDPYIRYCFDNADRLNEWNDWFGKYRKNMTICTIVSLLGIFAMILPTIFIAISGNAQNVGTALLPIALLLIFAVSMMIFEYKSFGDMKAIFERNIALCAADSMGILRKEINAVFIEQIDSNRKMTLWSIPLFIGIMAVVAVGFSDVTTIKVGVMSLFMAVIIVYAIIMIISGKKFQDKKDAIAMQIDEKLQKVYKDRSNF